MPPLGLSPILILAIFASKIRNCVLILQRYNLFELSIHSRLYFVHTVRRIQHYYTLVLCACTHFRGLTSLRAAQCNGILISNQHIGISNKTTLHKTFVASINSNTTLVYLRICIFHFSFVPIDLPTVSVCTVFCTYSRSIRILHILLPLTDTVYVYRTYSDSKLTFAHTVSQCL